MPRLRMRWAVPFLRLQPVCRNYERRQEMGRSRATKPTLAQKKLIRSEGLDAGDWLVLWENHSILQIVHRTSGSSRSIRKSPQLGSRRA